ncbi:unnamed protein product [Lymnaea stagnalis]|uniref:Uncharacterized protein n=1 Tax=Lymnaea stagnalis TaxID=6523 RepID=A0AAV2H9D1_LYMST
MRAISCCVVSLVFAGLLTTETLAAAFVSVACEFQCSDAQKCVPYSAVCNGVRDCNDGSDETIHCNTCGPERTFCQGVMKCVPLSAICNGVNDCGDNSDERNCPQGVLP